MIMKSLSESWRLTLDLWTWLAKLKVNSRVKPTQYIAKYLVKCNQLGTITGWDNHTLWRQFYHGLPAHIKDELSWVGKPETLPTLWALARSIEGDYWEWEDGTMQGVSRHLWWPLVKNMLPNISGIHILTKGWAIDTAYSSLVGKHH